MLLQRDFLKYSDFLHNLLFLDFDGAIESWRDVFVELGMIEFVKLLLKF